MEGWVLALCLLSFLCRAAPTRSPSSLGLSVNYLPLLPVHRSSCLGRVVAWPHPCPQTTLRKNCTPLPPAKPWTQTILAVDFLSSSYASIQPILIESLEVSFQRVRKSSPGCLQAP